MVTSSCRTSASSLIKTPTTASTGGNSGKRSEARTPSPIPSPRADRSALTRYAKKRAGSLSASSKESQATDLPSSERSSNHSLSKVVLPNPAGAETRVSLRPSLRTRASRKRGRGTSSGRVLGTRTFVVTSASGTADAPTGQPEPKLTPKSNRVKLCSMRACTTERSRKQRLGANLIRRCESKPWQRRISTPRSTLRPMPPMRPDSMFPAGVKPIAAYRAEGEEDGDGKHPREGDDAGSWGHGQDRSKGGGEATSAWT